MVEVEDSKFGRKESDLEGLKRCIGVNSPANLEEGGNKVVERLRESLEATKGKSKSITWPVLLILATRE